MRVLLGQLEVTPGEPARNVDRLIGALAAHPDADLAVFPELYLCGYDLDRVAEHAIAADDPLLGAVRDAARENATAVVVGFAERVGAGVANAVGCIAEDGGWAGTYRKTHLFGARERAVFTPGEELLVVQLAGAGVAPMVCFDVEFPEPARAVARAGAQLLVTVAANMAPYGREHELAAAARALDNRLPHVYVNRVGDEGGLHFVGGSCALSPDGLPGAVLGVGPDPAVVELAVCGRPADDVDYLRHARPDLPVHLPHSRSLEGPPR